MTTFTKAKRIIAIIMSAIMVLGIMPMTVFAAKDRVTSYEINSVAVDGIDAPKAGKKLDFTATENSQKYNIVAVAWRKSGSDQYLDESYTAAAGETYTVAVYLEVATPSHYFKTTSGRTSAITDVTVNGEAAGCDNAIDREVWAIDASKYDHDTTYQKAVRVIYTFPATKAQDIESIRINLTAPGHGEKVPTTPSEAGVKINAINGKENNGTVNVNSFEWSLQGGKMLAGNAKFEAGEKYTVKMELSSVYGTSFATDASHILSKPGKPFPAVEVEINGKTATVLPDTDDYGNYVIVASAVFDCEYSVIDELEINGITAPKAGVFPSYVVIVRGEGAKLATSSSGTSKNGITWIESGSSAVPVAGFTFEAETAYIVKIELEAEEGYIFDDPRVSLDGRTGGVEVDGNDKKITVTYVFQPTGLDVISSVTVENLDLPKDGASPDYTATVTDNRISLADDNDRFNKNGISWYNVTDDKAMYVGADKFEKGKTYEVYIRVVTGDDAVFSYSKDECKVSASVWNKLAETDGRSDAEVIITARYTVTDQPEKPDDQKPDDEKPDDTKPDTRKAIEKITVTGVEIKNPDPENPLGDDVKVTPASVRITEFQWDQTPVGTWKPGIANVYLEADKDSKFTLDTLVKINGYYAMFVATKDNTAIYRVTFEDVFKESPEEHVHNPYYAYTPFEHWLECACGNATGFKAHTYDKDNKCQICSYKNYDVTKLPFTDVKADDYFAVPVAWAYDTGVTTGTSATTFSPDMTCTRGQVVTFLWRAAGCPEPKTTKNPFKDVKESDYFYKAVLWAVESKITNGTSAKEFSPEMTCSTAHILTFLFRAAGIGKDGWYEEAADWAAYNDLLLSTNLEVNPETPCPRAAVVTFLYRIYG